MNQRSMNLAREVVEKTTDDDERARMEKLLMEVAADVPKLVADAASESEPPQK